MNFPYKGFKFQPNICNKCQKLLMMPINLSYIATLNIQGSDYCCIINGTSNLMPNADFMKKSKTL